MICFTAKKNHIGIWFARSFDTHTQTRTEILLHLYTPLSALEVGIDNGEFSLEGRCPIHQNSYELSQDLRGELLQTAVSEILCYTHMHRLKS